VTPCIATDILVDTSWDYRRRNEVTFDTDTIIIATDIDKANIATDVDIRHIATDIHTTNSY